MVVLWWILLVWQVNLNEYRKEMMEEGLEWSEMLASRESRRCFCPPQAVPGQLVVE